MSGERDFKYYAFQARTSRLLRSSAHLLAHLRIYITVRFPWEVASSLRTCLKMRLLTRCGTTKVWGWVVYRTCTVGTCERLKIPSENVFTTHHALIVTFLIICQQCVRLISFINLSANAPNVKSPLMSLFWACSAYGFFNSTHPFLAFCLPVFIPTTLFPIGPFPQSDWHFLIQSHAVLPAPFERRRAREPFVRKHANAHHSHAGVWSTFVEHMWDVWIIRMRHSEA